MKILEKFHAKQKDLYGQESVTIAFLGDSVTQGCFECYKTGKDSLETVFDNENAYAYKLKKVFNVLYPNVQVNIIDSGISGGSALNGALRLERDVLRYHPDLTVVCFGLNDSTHGEGEIRTYTSALAEIFDKLQAAGSEVIFMTPNMMNTYASCHLKDDELFLRLAKWFGEIQNDGLLDKYVEAAKQTAQAHGVKVCDCYSKWKALAANGVNTTELLANKLNHPIRELHWLFAYSLVETVFEIQ